MASFHSSFRFDTVVVLDSVPASEDPQTGPWLRDTVLSPLAAEHGFRLLYRRIENRDELFSSLASIARAVREAGVGPIVHFETHGTEQGLALADSDIVPWPVLKPWITDINRACRMNLLTVMSMCHGWHWVSQLQPVEPAPVWALIGPINETLPARLQEAFQAFYPALLSTMDAREAVNAMNEGREGSRWQLETETAEIMFARIWRGYESRLCSPEALREREDEMVATLMRGSNYDIRFAMHGRQFARERLANQEAMFWQFRRSFLMLDTFPENEPRFQLTYSQCVGTA